MTRCIKFTFHNVRSCRLFHSATAGRTGAGTEWTSAEKFFATLAFTGFIVMAAAIVWIVVI